MDHILGHKICLSKLKNNEIIVRVFSDHNTMRLESTTRKRNSEHKQIKAKQHVTKQPMDY